MIARCEATGCALDRNHHGPHARGRGELAMQWYAPPRHPCDCSGCIQLEDREVERLRAGGRLRPGQRMPRGVEKHGGPVSPEQEGGSHAPIRSNGRPDRDGCGVDAGALSGGNGSPTHYDVHDCNGCGPGPKRGVATDARAGA